MKLLLAASVAAVSLTFSAGAAQAQDLTVGVSWNNFQEERWKTDEAAIKEALDAAGAKYISADSQSSAEKQLTDIEGLIAQGANALIVLAQDSAAVEPAVQKALDEGIPVIGYDRLIEMPEVFYITFDNREVGRMQARAVYEKVPKGNYIFIKGNSADPNADFVHAGQLDVLQAALDSGDIKNVGESYTDNWNPSVAQTNTEQFLTANNNDVQAVVASNDGMAGGAVAALAAQGLDGSVAVSGQDGDKAALNRVAQGTQTVSVWKDARALGRAAGAAAAELANGAALNEVTGAVVFSNGPKGIDLNSILLAPVPITQDNLDVVIDAGWITKEEVCQDVDPGMTAVCG
jgi:D-xylose transport system substrate-binding protein